MEEEKLLILVERKFARIVEESREKVWFEERGNRLVIILEKKVCEHCERRNFI